ncbi:ABC-three component system protein [Demequina sp. NBRC 110052]|uniref:ABC-three component system protein n=1 Tax=Demequina sp. NBRC 110052 TaxID=1570341 RepID=UPI00117EDE56|nr:ABC-three component system protein [Demequina sp. NBRC 110052]
MSKFDASASAVGHLHQLHWALLELLRAGRKDKAIRVSLETYDDVALLRADGTLDTAEQVKHHQGDSTLTDGSPDLWKTLRVWLETPSLKDVSGPRLYLLTTASASEGSAVSFLTTEDHEPQAASELLTSLAETLTAEETKKGREAWLAATPAERLGVLQRVTIVTDAPHASETDQLLREELATAVRDEHADLLIERLMGWWHRITFKVLLAADVETISAGMLYNQIYSLRDEFLADALPVDLSLADVEDEIIEGLRSRPFVAQLGWVKVHGHNLRKAIVNYHRAYAQTSKWVQDGDLVEEDLTKFERDLIDEWEIQFENMCDQLELDGELTERDKVQAGRELFNSLYDANVVRIRATFAENFLTNGSRHILADRGDIGWHPDFKAKLEALLGVSA